MAEELRPGIDYIGVTTPFYCNDGNGNFVLHKRSENARDEKGRWDFGSGQLRFGEDIEEGMLRELEEEYGVKGQIQERVPAHSIIRKINGIKTHWVAVPFFVEIDTKKVKIIEPNKVTAIGIFSFPNLPRPLHTGAQISIRKYRSYFERYSK